MGNIHRSFCAALVSCAIPALVGTTAQAADESPWNEDVRSAIRLIAGSNKAEDPELRAGVEVKLRPGWKTYWRYPGDSGVPPHFDFSGSENLKKADVLFPAPHLFTDETGQSLGYKDTVIFPVVVSPQQAGKPVRLRVKVDYAVCEKLCVPVEGRAELTLVSGDSKHNPVLTTAETRVPKRVTAAQLGLTAKRVNVGAKPSVIVELGAPTGKPVELFVEGPTPQWALPIPKPVKSAPAGRAQFSFELDGLPPGVDPKGQLDLTFTVVTGDRAVETKTHLD
ncbi:MAG TPA: protein-disulfide reductase DsbD domain-containing protein [Pseudolabrys sp.]|jgi:DsbC/DsbD-like thiol-disulfide interchange protein|nr:protein-disulfide reductase DsbD domain-containing protein [Pseudolabrys sp.]